MLIFSVSSRVLPVYGPVIILFFVPGIYFLLKGNKARKAIGRVPRTIHQNVLIRSNSPEFILIIISYFLCNSTIIANLIGGFGVNSLFSAILFFYIVPQIPAIIAIILYFTGAKTKPQNSLQQLEATTEAQLITGIYLSTTFISRLLAITNAIEECVHFARSHSESDFSRLNLVFSTYSIIWYIIYIAASAGGIVLLVKGIKNKKEYDKVDFSSLKQEEPKPDKIIITPTPVPTPPPADESDDPAQKLIKLKQFLDNGIITQEEYELKKREIIKML